MNRALALIAALTVISIVTPASMHGAPPTNDNFANATQVSTIPFSAAIDLAEATGEAGEPMGCASHIGDVWFRMPTTSTQQVYRLTLTAPGTQLWGAVYRDTGSGITGLQMIIGCVYLGQPTNVTVGSGQTYYVRVARGYYATTTIAQLDIESISPPANDNFANAISIASLPFAHEVATAGASIEPGEPSLCTPPYSEKTVWYSYTASSSGTLTARSLSSVPTGVAAYEGSSLAGLTSLGCQYGFPLTIRVVAGTTYSFQVGGFGQYGPQLRFELISGPANDDFANASSITALPFTDQLSTIGASTETGEPLDCAVSKTVWYSYTARSSDPLRLQVDAGGYALGIAAYVGGSVSTLTRVGCQYGSQTLTIPVQPGTTYHFQIGGYNAYGYQLRVDLDFAYPDTTPPTIGLPADDITENATTMAGATVDYADAVTVSDNRDPNPTLGCAPATGSTFPIGDTTVTCTAEDAAHNTASEAFNVHVKGAAEQLTDLGKTVTGVEPGTSLADKVSKAQTALAQGDVPGTCEILNAFINQVKAQSGKRIRVATANSLMADAARIRAVLGCES